MCVCCEHTLNGPSRRLVVGRSEGNTNIKGHAICKWSIRSVISSVFRSNHLRNFLYRDFFQRASDHSKATCVCCVHKVDGPSRRLIAGRSESNTPKSATLVDDMLMYVEHLVRLVVELSSDRTLSESFEPRLLSTGLQDYNEAACECTANGPDRWLFKFGITAEARNQQRNIVMLPTHASEYAPSS